MFATHREVRMKTDSRFPSLQTARLRLRAPDLDDASAYHEILSLREVTRYINLRDSPTSERSRKFVRWMTGLHSRGRGCAWIMESLATHDLVGAIRIDEIDTRSRCGTVGYEMHPAWWGRGLMSEALGALVGCAHTDFELNRLEAWTLHGNTASDKVLTKNGFRYEGTLRQKSRFKGAFHDLRMFSHLASDTTMDTTWMKAREWVPQREPVS